MCLPISAPEQGLVRYLFLDINSYFATCEQALQPDLRGKPIAVVPTPGDSATIIAASYEAKKFGIFTGCKVREAKAKCPEIILCSCRPSTYVEIHETVLDTLQKILPIDEICSVDEMRFKLLGSERRPQEAEQIALKMKDALRKEIAPNFACSIGLASNGFVAKLGTELQKPDGLVTILPEELPHRLANHRLTFFPGINRRMADRLRAKGIFNSDDLIAASPEELRAAFGSWIGEKWWYLLRGYEVQPDRTRRHTIGHSHVLAPERRSEEGVLEVLYRLATKAASRLRGYNLFARHVEISVKGIAKSWKIEKSIPPTRDTMTCIELVRSMWSLRDFSRPIKASVTFSKLVPREQITLDLFDSLSLDSRASDAMDQMNKRFGKDAVSLGTLVKSKSLNQHKIAFHAPESELFKENRA